MQNIFWIENDWVAPWDFARPREEQTQTIVLIEQGEKGVIPPLQTSTLLSVQVGDIFWLFICNSRRLMICPAKKNNKRKTKLFGTFYFWGVSFYLILGSAAASHVRNLFHLIRHEIFFLQSVQSLILLSSTDFLFKIIYGTFFHILFEFPAPGFFFILSKITFCFRLFNYSVVWERERATYV